MQVVNLVSTGAKSLHRPILQRTKHVALALAS